MTDIGIGAVGVGAIAVGLEFVFGWPQAVDAVRSPDVSGISPLTALLMWLTAASWFGYGLLAGDPMVIAANAVMLVSMSIIVGALAHRARLQLTVATGVLLAWIVAVTAAGLQFGAPGVGVLGAALGISMVIPQTVHAVVRGTVAGVAISSYVMLVALQAAWLVYGLLVSDAVIVIPNVIALPLSATALAVLLTRRASTAVSLEVATAET